MLSATASIMLGILSMFGFGIADTIAKSILSSRNAIRIAVFSQAIGTVLFLLVALVFDPFLPAFAIICLALVSGVLSAVVLSSYYLALGLGKASIVSPISSCMTVVAVSLSLRILGESLTLSQLALVSLVFVGIILVASDFSDQKEAGRKLSIILALLAAVIGGANIIVQKWIADSTHYLMAFFLSRVFMIFFMLPVAPLIADKHRVVTSRNFLKFATLGLLDVSGFFAWYIGLRVGLVSIVSPIALSSPAVTVVLAHIFLKERVQSHQLLGIIAIIAGIALLSAIS
jgi:drug/metabolite transporter (DMT)-like permease